MFFLKNLLPVYLKAFLWKKIGKCWQVTIFLIGMIEVLWQKKFREPFLPKKITRKDSKQLFAFCFNSFSRAASNVSHSREKKDGKISDAVHERRQHWLQPPPPMFSHARETTNSLIYINLLPFIACSVGSTLLYRSLSIPFADDTLDARTEQKKILRCTSFAFSTFY